MLRSPTMRRRAFAIRIDAVDAHGPDQPDVSNHASVCCNNVQACAMPSTAHMPLHLDSQHSAADQASKSKWDLICADFPHVFAPPQQPVECSIKHHIELLDPTAPIPNHKQYRLSQAELDEAKRQIDELLAKGWI